jgi:AraC-like DNA-binding protein
MNDRPSHGFIYKIEGTSYYMFNQKTIALEKNEMMYVPNHSHYAIRADNGGRYIVVNFSMSSPEPTAEPMKIVFKDHSKVLKLFLQMQYIWVLKNDTDILTIKSILYQIMAEISRQQDEETYISPVAKEKIAAAIQYLRKHLFDADLRVSDLYEMLDMSSTYFRQLFRQIYSTTPIQYINRERIEQAKALLISGEFQTLEQVAIAVGYADAYYFCKVFKDMTGHTPTTWKQMELKWQRSNES